MQKRLGLDLEIPDEFGYWLAGFVDGEGTFTAYVLQHKGGYPTLDMRFEIALRADDNRVLMCIKDRLGVGYIHYQRPSPSSPKRAKPKCAYKVTRLNDLYHIIIPLFEMFPLRSKKARDFETWKEIIRLRYSYGHAKPYHAIPDSAWEELRALCSRLKVERKYIPYQPVPK